MNNMAITFSPEPGAVLMCDFSVGAVPPEMTKIRHVVVISPRRRRGSGSGSCIVVPFSTGAPNPVERYHYCIQANTYDFFKKDTAVWAKGDMVNHVSFQRLDRVLVNGKHTATSLNPEDLRIIQQLVWEALGCPIMKQSDMVLPNGAEKANKRGETLLYKNSPVL
jgi:uncharacterized protein YifN (PemK superfamily)